MSVDQLQFLKRPIQFHEVEHCQSLWNLMVRILAQSGKEIPTRAMLQAQQFHIDNVAEWRRSTREEDRRVVDWAAMPNIAPLGPAMWFEYAAKAVGDSSTKRYGSLLTVDYEREKNWRSAKYQGKDVPESIRWIVRAMYCGTEETAHGWAMWYSPRAYYLAVGDEGSLEGFTSSPNFAVGDVPEDAIKDEEGKDILHEELELALLSLCFSHCKGVIQHEIRPSRQVARQLERRKEPIFTYKQLDIAPARQVLSVEGNVAENGIERALHICRGHFAHYTTDKPLFGKLTGTFYVPMHTRGTLKAGAVVKDYNVKAPAVAQ